MSDSRFNFFKSFLLVLIAVIVMFPCALFAAPLDLTAKVDKETITIGDKIQYEVIIEHDDSVSVEPMGIAENLGEFEIKDYHIEEPKKTKDKRWMSKTTYIITTFTTGDFVIPPVKVKYKDMAGQEKEVSSEEIKIKVESVKPGPTDKDDIRDLKGPAEIKGRSPWALFIILALFIVLGVAAFIYFNNKKRAEDTPSAPSRPPEEIAMDELRYLLDMRLSEKGMIKEYYIRISDILRKYIEARFKVLALDRTTWELYQEMRFKRIERRHVDMIRDFLEDCDLVKFAKYIPAKKEIEGAHAKAKEIIEMTTPKIAITG